MLRFNPARFVESARLRHCVPRGSRMGLIALTMIVVVGAIALPQFGIAADTRSGGDVTIRASETITEDLYLGAGTVDFLGTAQRDVLISTGEMTFDGQIRGSLNLIAGRADINGGIVGSLRVLGGQVRITGDVGGDVVVAGGQLEVTSSATIGGNIVMAGGEVDVRGRVGGDVQGYVGSATIGGTIQGLVDLNTTNLEILDTARITGSVTYTSRSDADVSAGAQLAGGIDQQETDPWGNGENPLSRASGSLLRTLWALVAGALLVLAAPRVANQLGSNGKRIVRSLLFGVAMLVVAPIVAILLMVTVVGIPAGIVLFALFLMALYLTQVFVGLAIGRFILPNGWNDGSRGYHLLAMTLGVILLGGLRFIPVPYAHSALMLIVTVWGMGAALMLLGSFNRQDRVTAADTNSV